MDPKWLHNVIEPGMPNLSIKDVPEQWAEALRRRAARHHRSLQGELMAIVEQALQGGPAAPAHPLQAGVVAFDKRGWPILRQGGKTVAQVADELRAQHPSPARKQLSSIDLIRADRDRR